MSSKSDFGPRIDAILSARSYFQQKAFTLRRGGKRDVELSRHTQRWLRRDHIQRQLKARVRDRAVTCFPRIPPDLIPEGEKARDKFFFRSDDPRYLALLDDLDRSLFSLNPSVFSNRLMRGVAGYPAVPVECPQRNNAAGLERDNLGFELSPKEKLFLIAYGVLLFGFPIPAKLRLKKGGSPGAVPEPYGRLDTQLRIASRVLDSSTSVRDLLASGTHSDLIKADEVFSAPLVSTRLHRVQQDKISWVDGKFSPKQRLVPTDPYGEVFTSASKDLPLDFSHLEFFRLRLRGVSNPSLGANLLMISSGACIRTGYYHRWRFTFHHRTAAEIESSVSHWTWAKCYDMVRFDVHFLVEIFALMLDTLELLGYDRVFCEYVWNFHMQPILMHGSLKDSPGWPLFGADPFLLKSFDFWGLGSGSGGTDIFGKYGGGGAVVVVNVRAGLLQRVSELIPYLEGRHDRCGNKNGGDDNLVGGCYAEDAAKFDAAIRPFLEESGVAVPWKFSPDDRFLGNRVEVKNQKVTLSKYEPSLIANSFWKEHDLHRKTNVEIATGFTDRFDLLTTTPVGRDAVALMDRVLVKHLGFSYTRLAATQSHGSETADVIFRMNPNSIFYKLDPQEVSPEVLEEAVFSFPDEDNWSFFQENAGYINPLTTEKVFNEVQRLDSHFN